MKISKSKLVVLLMLAACTIIARAAEDSDASLSGNAVRGTYLEGCECYSVCPCLWEQDATEDQCRAIMAWRISAGAYNGTSLAGTTFAVSLTKSAKNIGSALGNLEGTLYLPADASDTQREAIRALFAKELGPAFGKSSESVKKITMTGKDGTFAFEIAGVAKLTTIPLKGAKGGIPSIDNPPSPLGLTKNYCAKSVVHTYDDGKSKWDFGGRNSFFGSFEIDHN